MRRPLAAVLAVAAAWTALGVFFGVTTSLTYISQGREPLWRQALLVSLAQWWIWAALTPLVVLAARRWPIEQHRLVVRLPVHLTIALAAAVAKVTMEGWVRTWLFGVRPYILFNNLALQVLIYFALVALVQALDRFGRQRARALEAEARFGEARLQLLRAQLQPHFLFNALNGIAELIHEDPGRADEMIGRLSVLLRASLATGDRQEVALDDELHLVCCYCDIQQARFGARLEVAIDASAEARLASVPQLLVQPLVENAIQHGISGRPGGGRVRVLARAADRFLVIAVEDDGVGWPSPAPPEGVGLTNTRARLASLYGTNGRLRIQPRPEGGTVVTITLPYRRVLDPEEG